MRVLLLTGPAEGGIRRHVEALARGLPAEGVTCGLAGPSKPDWPSADPGRELPWFRVPLDDRMLTVLVPPTVQALRTAWRRERWDLLHAHGFKATVLAWLASHGAPSRSYVVTLHNLCPPSGRLGAMLIRASLGGARRIIGVSQAVLDSLGPRLSPRVQATVIPNGVDGERFACLPAPVAVRHALGLVDQPLVLFLGRLTKEKGVRVLAEAAAMLAGEPRPAVVCIAGEGPERSWLEAAATVTPSLRLLGARDDVPTLLSACDVVVVPSLREGQSLVALEAMAAARPLVVSAVGGLSELASASGAAWTVPPGDATALARAVGSLLGQPETRVELAARGWEYARRHGDWQTMVERVAAVYRAAAVTR